LGNFSPLISRPDKGVLWENFLVSERLKFQGNNERDVRSYFWRTTQQQEIDYIEEYSDRFLAWEFKWNSHRKVRLSKTFTNAYPNHEFKVITPENIQDFLLQ
jgi:predicted AAA+ superfamily ATPase